MRRLHTTSFALLLCITLQAQTITLPPYYGVQNKPDFICGESTVTDDQGNVYNTVKIGEQCWLKQNLRSTKYNDGTNIPNVTNNTTWESLTTPAYCWYNNDFSTYGSVYGALYNWYAVNTGNLCPVGWHVPSDAEWTELTDYLGGTSVAGGKLKETGTTHWLSPNIGATNETSFTALPSGCRTYEGFSGLQYFGTWWSATEREIIFSWYHHTYYNHSGVPRESATKKTGFSIRCLKN